MFIIECWKSEVIINRMDFKSSERIHWSPGPLPDITHWVVYALCLVLIHRGRRSMDNANIVVIFLMIEIDAFQKSIILVFSG